MTVWGLVGFLMGQAPAPVESTSLLAVMGPYLAAAMTAIGGVMGYGALREKVANQDKQRTDDIKAQEAADLAIRQALRELKEEHARELMRLRNDFDRDLDILRQRDAQRGVDLNGIGGKLNAMNREIGEVKTDTLRAVEAERHRIDEHAKRNGEQQTKNAEFYASQAKEILERIERRLGNP